MKVTWTIPAKFYLKEIFSYYRKVAGIAVGRKIRSTLIRAAGNLKDNPALGIIEEKLELDGHIFRSLIASHYKIIYRIDGDFIFIVDVFDTRQSPEKMSRSYSQE